MAHAGRRYVSIFEGKAAALVGREAHRVREDGPIELWQDGTEILSARGRTLPLPETILNSWEVGITANNGATDAVVYVDDIWIGTTPAPSGMAPGRPQTSFGMAMEQVVLRP